MSGFIGADKPSIQEMSPVRERISFVYLEKCIINRTDSAISAKTSEGVINIPAASMGVLMLGPGTSITHRAMELIGNCGVTVLWVGEKCTRVYASGSPLTRSSRLLIAQSNLVSNRRSRLRVARQMYAMRFPDEDVTGLTMQQLRGREGSRIRTVYRRMSEDTGVEWNGRKYNPVSFEDQDAINRALSIANSCLYGLAHCAIVSLGCSPGLGFIHNGRELAFVYDVADLYKTETSIPVAFEAVSEHFSGSYSAVRRKMRDMFSNSNLLERMVCDIKTLLLGSDSEEISDYAMNPMELWDDKNSTVPGGRSYGR